MANIKITDLTDIGTPDPLDVLEIVDVSTNTSKKVKVSELGGGVETVTGALIDNTDPLNPIVNVPTLQQVTDTGDETTNQLTSYNNINSLDPLLSGKRVVLNPIDGVFITTNAISVSANLKSDNLTDNRIHQLPDASGTVALTSDIPTLQQVTDESPITTNGIQSGGFSTTANVNSASFEFNDADVLSNLKGNLSPSDEVSILSPKDWKLINESGDLPIVTTKSANFTAVNNAIYKATATLTVTDPTPVTGKGFQVHVIGGTSTIGGVAYTSGALVYRYYNGSVWISTDMNSAITIDATPTDGSTNAVSSNGVFDALALKTGRLISDATVSTPHTGTATNTIVKSYLIPANTFASSDCFNLVWKMYKTGVGGTMNVRAYVNTSIAIPANPIVINFLTSTLIYSGVNRSFRINGGNLYFPNTASITTGSDDSTSASATEQSVSFNVAVDNYLILAVQLGNTADSVTINQVLARQ